jgi:hypothetical protein
MPRTNAQQERSLQDPAVCELLKVRDFLDNVMVRTDGCYVAGYRVAGALTYFADDDGRNDAKAVLEALLRALPEESMRLQCRYEVVESLNGLLDRYRMPRDPKFAKYRRSMRNGLRYGRQRRRAGNTSRALPVSI